MIVVEKKDEALRTTKELDRPDTVWADGSRQEDGAVEEACVWRSPEGRWTGRLFQPGKNKEVFDAEVFAVWQALRALEQRNERDRKYVIFMDSASAITRVRDDARGPGQRFGVAAIEVETRLAAAGNRVTIYWVPAHAGAEGDEVADQCAKDAATGRAPRERFAEGYAEETSLTHMTRVATETRSKTTTDWITEHVRPRRRYRPLPGKSVRRTQLRRVKKTLLPATVRPCGDGNPPPPLRQDRHAGLLVVRQRRAPVQASSFHEGPGMAPPNQEAMEGGR